MPSNEALFLLGNIDSLYKINKKLIYLQGVSQREIGGKFNLSQSYVSRVIKSMKLKFKAAYGDERRNRCDYISS